MNNSTGATFSLLKPGKLYRVTEAFYVNTFEHGYPFTLEKDQILFIISTKEEYAISQAKILTKGEILNFIDYPYIENKYELILWLEEL